ncbi:MULTISPECIES: helix-turn-helix domain-containing protein [Bacteria]|uniref:helix-turn-helix domain-containing protein n=1 Tax=Bacteria TaxID=2 RepID=UPI002E7C26CD|nr:helix-turn-helix transcriptional regulator [Cetobacterium somerae]WVJ03069.1 helix-turn-helix transcriptional regulator [Cetobacterium somerae]
MKIVLEKTLKKKNVTIYRLSKELNLSYKTTYNLVKGNTNTLKIDILKKICEILDVDVADILIKKNVKEKI